MDSARARLTKLEGKLAASQAAVAEAQRQSEAAAAEVEAQRQVLADLEAEVVKRPALTELEQVVEGVQALLQSLESSRLVTLGTSAPPEPVLASMQRMHQLLGNLNATADDSDSSATGAASTPNKLPFQLGSRGRAQERRQVPRRSGSEPPDSHRHRSSSRSPHGSRPSG